MKSLINPNLYFVLLILFLFTCQKENFEQCTGTRCIIFEGKITDRRLNIPLDNVLIEAIFDSSSYGDFFPSAREVGKSQSNKDGYFRLSFPGEDFATDNGYFIIKFSKNGYSPGELNFYTIDSTSFDTPIIADFELLPR